ncbi:MAG: hypothetical protein OEY14_10875, partial [Myxococcales bacterium]|nr:hypothetical protein [Myxococcales bacterium]
MRSQTEIHFDPLSSGRDSVPELPRLIERVGASSRSEGPDLALLGIGAGPLPGQLPIRRRPGRSRRAEALLLASALVGLGSIALAATIARLPAAGPPAASRPNAAPV